MLNTIKATLLPSGMLTFAETLSLDHAIPVWVTRLEEYPVTQTQPAPLMSVDPLDWPLTDEERGVLEAFPMFRAEHPIHLNSLEAET